MRQYGVILYFALVAATFAQPGYRYQQQQPQQQQQQQQPIRQHAIPTGSFRPQQPQSNSGIYSVVQSPPLAQFQQGPIQQQQQNFVSAPQPAPAVIGLPAPAQISLPQQSYLPPQQQQQQQQPQQTYQAPQQTYLAPIQQQTVAIPSIPQSHQQQIVQQQVSFQPQPQQQNDFQQNVQNSGYQSFQRPQTAIITKDIYIHSAPEDQEESGLGQQLDNSPIRKNYRIVFIKAPTQNLKLAAAALKRAQGHHEEKTVIYVLSKKPDLSEVQQQLQQSQGETKSHKPEVYFIKYKTQEEAQRAQQEIQAQYDALGGSTHISDEGVAPLTSVIGAQRGAAQLSLPIGGGANFGQQSFAQQSFQSQSIGGSSSSSFGGTAPSQKYLPVVKALK